MSSRELQNAMLERVRLKRKRAVTAAFRVKYRYKTNFDRHVKQVLAFAEHDPVYLDKRSPETYTKAYDTSQKLQEKKAGSYKIVTVQPKTVRIGKNGIFDTVIIYRISIAQQLKDSPPPSPTGHKIEETDCVKPTHAKPKTNEHIGPEREFDSDCFDSNENHADEYVMCRIVDHTVKGKRPLYRVQWNEYAACEDTAESA